MDKTTLAKLNRLLKKFPEPWVHTAEFEKADDGGFRTFHHVDYKSGREGRPKVRLVSHVSADMCEFITTLKNAAPELIEVARALLAFQKPKPENIAKVPRKRRKSRRD